MSWTQASDIKAQLQRLWDRGEILAEAIVSESRFPRRLVLKAPNASEISSRFEEVRRWIADIIALKNCRVVLRETNHRQLGKNKVPTEIWIDSVEDALVWLGKARIYKQFMELVDLTRSELPAAVQWLRANALRAVEFAATWEKLLRVVQWIQCNPRPGIYLREVDLPGIDSKFIEQNRAILADLLDAVLPAEMVNATVSGATQFAARYGFCTERERIRFRILDPACALFGGGEDQDITVDVDTFVQLRTRVKTVFITENKTNFLAFPPTPDSMVVFGSGYGWDALARAHWLFHCDVYYWGDIDTHGFAILNQLRSSFPHVRSLLMDEKTARGFAHLAVDEPKATEGVFEFLTDEESDAVSLIRSGTLRANFRLEQERVNWNYARSRIEAAILDSTTAFASPPIEFWSSDFSTYFVPSRCEKRTWLIAQPGASRDLALDDPSHLVSMIGELTEQHRLHQLSQVTDVVDLSQIACPDERFACTLSAISSRSPAIQSPLLVVATRIADAHVRTYAEADLLRLNSDGRYELVDFKLTRRLTEHPEIVHKLSLFAWAFENVTSSNLVGAYLQNADSVPFPVNLEISEALRVLSRIVHARSFPTPRYEPVGWTKCGGCCFRTHCWSDALESKAIGLLPDVDQDLATALHRIGTESYQSLRQRFDVKTLAEFQYRSAGRSVRVGKRAEAIFRAADALQSDRVIWLRQNELTLPPTVAVIDFEGVPPLVVPEESVYLWGIQLFGEDPSAYRYSLRAEPGQASDQSAWLEFLRLCESALTQDPSIQFFHYHHYETAMIRKYIDRYGDRGDIACRVLEACVDLHALLRDRACLPVFSYSLKEVERYLGFARSQDEYGGDWSVAAYLKAIDEDCPSATFEQILRYNAEDIASSWALLVWLRDNCPTLGQERLVLDSRS